MSISIRPFASGDTPQVTQLFQSVFRDGAETPAPWLERHIREIFAEHPDPDPAVQSLIAVDETGHAKGFVGTFPLRLSLDGRSIRAAVAGSLMSENPEQNPLVGARLLRALANGPYDLVVSETTNDIAFAMWQRIGGVMLPWRSMYWRRVLRPAAINVRRVANRLAPEGRLASIGLAADWLETRLRGNASRPSVEGFSDAEASEEDVISFFQEASSLCELKPEIGDETLRWRLRHAELKAEFGECHRRRVFDKRGRPAGCYIYHGRRGHFAHTFQMIALPGAHGVVLDSLFAHAYAQGCIAVVGCGEDGMAPAAIQRGCSFLRGDSMVVYSKQPELAEAARRRRAILNGLAAETWCRLTGNR